MGATDNSAFALAPPPAEVSLDAYHAFLRAKIATAPSDGFRVALGDLNPWLKDHVKVMVQWALAGGRRALFASFGLGKTGAQIEWAWQVLLEHVGAVDAAVLIVAPLGVRQEFMRDAAAMQAASGVRNYHLNFIRTTAEIRPGINVTNYESVRDGKLDVSRFVGVSLDEASILRGFGGSKTFREFMRLFPGARFKMVATATPSPNEYIELLAYAAFLDVMDVGQAKTRFFKRDSTKADTLSLHPHKEREFWLWVASWALFVLKPSDLGCSDEGYDLPPLDVRWHEIPSDIAGHGAEKSGQFRLLDETAHGVVDAAREKRDSLNARLAKLLALRAEDPAAHRVIWHDLEAERHALQAALPNLATVYGSQDLKKREDLIIRFSDGEIPELAAKPSIAGSGTNFQRHCWWAVFLGIGFKFNDFIQAIHRLRRFLQTRKVRVDLIYTERERETRRTLEAKWRRHDEQVEIMTGIIREFGLSQVAMAQTLARSLGVERVEVTGENHRCVNADCVEETGRMAADSVDLIVTSIPFSTQYEYTPSYNDFGHTDDDRHFWAQMDFLIPRLLRVLRPGRQAVIHVKDRIVPGGLTGLGFQTVSPFHADTIYRFRAHGFAFLGMRSVTTDVVRENNQTYRLGWSEQCKDGSRMGAGTSEYLLMFRKPPTDSSNGYADLPVAKPKREWSKEKGDWNLADGYSRARWQVDAAGYWRSAGDRLLKPEEIAGLPSDTVFKVWRDFSVANLYDFEHHVRVAEGLEQRGQLPPTFSLLPAYAPLPWRTAELDAAVWSDVTRMLTLNGQQAAKNREMHLCPLQFDIVDRLIAMLTMPGETVLDPFGGLMTVPYRALKLRRKGIGIELNPHYFLDGVAYCEAMAREMATPSLLDYLEAASAGPQNREGQAKTGGQEAAE